MLLVNCVDYNVCYTFTGENTVNGDHSDAHMSTLSQSSKEVCSTNMNSHVDVIINVMLC